MKLNLKALVLGFSLTWGIGVLFLGILATYFGYGTQLVEILGSIYRGFEPSLKGIIIGFLRALVDGGTAGLIFGLLYNFFTKE